MFCQHQVIFENRELRVYLFLFDQDISLSMMRIIFSRMPSHLLESHVQDYLETITINPTYHIFRIVYRSTIIRDLNLSTIEPQKLLVI